MSENLPSNKRARVDPVPELNSLEQLKLVSVVVADTGEFSTIKVYNPQGR